MTKQKIENAKESPQNNTLPSENKKFPTGLIIVLSIVCVAVIVGMATLNMYVQMVRQQYISNWLYDDLWVDEYSDEYEDFFDDWEDDYDSFDRMHPREQHHQRGFFSPPNELGENLWQYGDIYEDYTLLYGDYETMQEVRQLLAPYTDGSLLENVVMFSADDGITISVQVNLIDTQESFSDAISSSDSIAMHDSIAQVFQQI